MMTDMAQRQQNCSMTLWWTFPHRPRGRRSGLSASRPTMSRWRYEYRLPSGAVAIATVTVLCLVALGFGAMIARKLSKIAILTVASMRRRSTARHRGNSGPGGGGRQGMTALALTDAELQLPSGEI